MELTITTEQTVTPPDVAALLDEPACIAVVAIVD